MINKSKFQFWIPFGLFIVVLVCVLSIVWAYYLPESFFGKWLLSDLSTKCTDYNGTQICDTAPNMMVFFVIGFAILFGPELIIGFSPTDFSFKRLILVVINFLIYFLIGLIIDWFREKKITPKGVIKNKTN